MAGQLASTTEKKALRAEFLARRDARDADDCRQRSAEICQRLGQIEPVQAADCVAGYAALHNEVDLTAYLRARLASDVWLYFPRVGEAQTLDFVRVKRLDTLVPGAFGVLEPIGESAPKSEIDVFLVPGVAFDRQGNRVGFGGGYYDRALAATKKLSDSNRASAPLLVGICYQWQLIDGKIPVESYDITMDMIVTDEQLLQCSAGRVISPDS